MGLRAWVGFIAVSFCVPIYYIGFWPAWSGIRAQMVSSGVVSLQLLDILDKGVDWAPLMCVFAALLYAVISPAYVEASNTWRG